VSKRVTAIEVGTKKGMDWIAPRQARPTATRLYLSETRHGAWVVRDEKDRRGGRFFTYEGAMKYIRTEFGAVAQIVATHLVHKKAA
jgi:hypothetical protein